MLCADPVSYTHLAGLYDQMSGGNLRRTMTSLTHKNLPLAMFLEFSDLGISAWTGNTTGTQNNSDIINTLGVGIVWFDEAPPEGEIEAPDVAVSYTHLDVYKRQRIYNGLYFQC